MGKSDTLYNVTFNLEDTRTLLVPKVPYSAGNGEDKETPRVCFCTTLEGCMCALGPCSRDLAVGNVLVVRSVSVDDVDVLKLVSPEYLFSTQRVPDALYTGEYWYTSPVNVVRRKYVINGFQSEHCINWTVVSRELLQGILDVNKVNYTIPTDEESAIAYCNVMRMLSCSKQWDLMDLLYEDIAELPWAQAFHISNLKLEEI